MKITTKTLFLAAALSVALSSALASGHEGRNRPSENVPAAALQYQPTGIGPLQAADAYGDKSTGEHSTFIKLPAGFVSPLHAHTGDYHAVVLTGVIVNVEPGEKDVPLSAGSYWTQEGGKMHVTKCIGPTECTFFVGQSEKFDFILSK